MNLRKFIDLKPVGNYRFKRHLKPILYFFAASAATSVYTNLDTVMLGFMNTQTEVGLYSAAVKLKDSTGDSGYLFQAQYCSHVCLIIL